MDILCAHANIIISSNFLISKYVKTKIRDHLILQPVFVGVSFDKCLSGGMK